MRWDIFVKPFKVKLKVWHFDPIDSFISNALWCCVGEKWLRKKTAVPILMALAVYCLLMPDGGKAALRAEQKWGRNSNDTRLRPVKLRDRAINHLSFFSVAFTEFTTWIFLNSIELPIKFQENWEFMRRCFFRKVPYNPADRDSEHSS